MQTLSLNRRDLHKIVDFCLFAVYKRHTMKTITLRMNGTRTYPGEDTAGKLLAWLNTSGDDDRVKLLLVAAEKLRTASEVATSEMFMSLARKVAKGEMPREIEDGIRRAPDPDLPKRGHQAAFYASHKSVNEILDVYKLSPFLIWTINGKWTTGWRLAPGQSETPEVTAVMAALQLASQGLLHRVRRCKNLGCGRWLFARLPWKECCCPKCQQRFNQTDAEFRKKHAEDMRKNRADNKKRNILKAIALHEKGWSASRIAKHMKVLTSTVQNWLLSRTRR
jgi:predicted RNA-binding Zn ribbon-like protein